MGYVKFIRLLLVQMKFIVEPIIIVELSGTLQSRVQSLAARV